MPRSAPLEETDIPRPSAAAASSAGATATGPGSEEPTLGQEATQALGTVLEEATRDFPSNLKVRIPVLVASLLLVFRWLVQELDFAVGSSIIAVGAAAPVALKSLLAVVKDRLEADLRAAIRWGLSFLLQTWILAPLGALVFGLSAFLSSLTVTLDGTDVQGDALVWLRPLADDWDDPLLADADTFWKEEGEPDYRGSKQLVDVEASPWSVFTTLTTPFGRSFVLEVDGYEPQVIDLFPFVEHEIHAARDLRLAPTVLLRFPPGDRGDRNGGYVVLERPDGAAGWVEIGRAGTIDSRGSILLGPPRPIPDDRLAFWRRQYAAFELEKSIAGREPLTADYENLTLFEWEHPVVLRTTGTLRVGSRYRARFWESEASEAPGWELEFAVGSDPFQDHAVWDDVVPTPPPPPESSR